MIEDIQSRIRQMEEARQGINETFVSVSNPDDPRAQLLLADLRGREIPNHDQRQGDSDPHLQRLALLFTPQELEMLCRNVPSSEDYELMAHFPVDQPMTL